MIHEIGHMLYIANKHIDHPYVSGTLIAAVIPAFFTTAAVQAVYFLLLIPPAAWHCYQLVVKSIIPEVKKLFKR